VKTTEELAQTIEELTNTVSNLTNRVKTAELNTKEVSKENKKLKKELHGLRDAHNERVKEFIGNKGSIEAISQHIQTQYQITQSLRYAMSTVLDKGLITQEEITAFTTNLMETAKKQKGTKDGEAPTEQADTDETEKPSEEGSVQPEGSGTPESDSGTSDS